MKKIFIRGTMVAVFAAIAGYGVYGNQKEEVTLSDTALANVEALARGEEGFNDCFGCEYVTLDLCKTFGDWGACLGVWDGHTFEI